MQRKVNLQWPGTLLSPGSPKVCRVLQQIVTGRSEAAPAARTGRASLFYGRFHSESTCTELAESGITGRMAAARYVVRAASKGNTLTADDD